MNYDIELNANDSSTLETQYAFTQGDYGQIQFSIRVKANGVYVTNAQRAYIVFTLPNGYVVTGADMSKSVATYTYPFQGNELQVPGTIFADVKLVYTDGQISSNKFSFICRYDPLFDKSFDAGPYVTAFQQIVNDGQAKINYLQTLIDALQSDVGSTVLTRSDLVNNALANTAGIAALDAVMGKTLQTQITTLNSNLTVTKVTYGWGLLFKYGKLRTLEILGTVTLGSGVALLTLSASDKPNDTMFAPIIYGSPYNLGSVRIGTDGTVTLRDNSDNTPDWSSAFFRGQISWYVS